MMIRVVSLRRVVDRSHLVDDTALRLLDALAPAPQMLKIRSHPRTRIERLANEEGGVTADTALRLSKALGTTAALWLNLQNDFDIRMARREIGKELDKIASVIERRPFIEKAV
jgi:plasmid maintenance system antidote protein VapI